jgi:hypothetical protein
MMTANQWAFQKMARQMLLWLGGGLLLLPALVLALMVLATSPENPRSIPYQLWKANLISLDHQTVLRAFYSDTRRGDLVLGKSEQEIAARLGPLEAPETMTPYYRDFARDPRWKDKKTRYIRGTAWLIAFENNRAVNLLLVKG